MPMEHRYWINKSYDRYVFHLGTTEEFFLIFTSCYSVVYIMERSDGTQTVCVKPQEKMLFWATPYVLIQFTEPE